MKPLATMLALVLCAACASAAPTDAPSAPPAQTNPPTPAPTAAPTADLETRFTNLLEHERQRDGAPGMLGLVRHGDDRIWAVSGSADVNGTGIKPATRFRIASVTKPIIATLVLMSVQYGRFALDDSVKDLIPGVLRPEPPVTVRQLLDHTSGIYDEGNEGVPLEDIELIPDESLRDQARDLWQRHEAGQPVVITDRIWIALAETHDRYNEPGAGYHYSNVNYQVLGMILEAKTGSSLADLLRTQIVEPLNLRFTSLAPADRSTPEMHGYQAGAGDELEDITNEIGWFGNGGNGGVISTADELLTIMQAIVGGRLFSSELLAEMKTPPMGTYGLGLGTYDLTCGIFYGHEGAVLGTRSIALVSEDAADGVVAAVNVFSDLDPRLPAVADTMVCLGR